ncbi:N-terminal glutamine amidase-domain-containing protein [Crassisporium funariophilum]|nr:N-terminal glutamine amidase-domain-containing protein [Crassisporium funariophilum]
MNPPPIPSGSVYTSYWCEENIYLLCQTYLRDQLVIESWEIFVIFISNAKKTVALWHQKASRLEGDPVVWDYHVILMLRPKPGCVDSAHAEFGVPEIESWVYDFDTCLPMPCPWKDYLSTTFPPSLSHEYESRFRVIPGDVFLQEFASDRSHMLVKAESPIQTDIPVYISPPPLYDPICGSTAVQKGIQNNLMSQFVDMRQVIGDVIPGGFGQVLDRGTVDSITRGY